MADERDEEEFERKWGPKPIPQFRSAWYLRRQGWMSCAESSKAREWPIAVLDTLRPLCGGNAEWERGFMAGVRASKSALRAASEGTDEPTGAKEGQTADEERLRAAAERSGVGWWGCDTPEHMADEIEALRARLEAKEGPASLVSRLAQSLRKMVDNANWQNVPATESDFDAMIAEAEQVLSETGQAQEAPKEK